MKIARAVLEAVYAHARAEFPGECCGYLTGSRSGDVATTAVACHNAARDRATTYEIAGDELYAFVRSLDRGDEPALAIYHSHTHGRAYFSDRDARIAATDAGPIYPVAHLVVGVTATAIVEAALFAWSASARAYVEIAREHGIAGSDFGTAVRP